MKISLIIQFLMNNSGTISTIIGILQGLITVINFCKIFWGKFISKSVTTMSSKSKLDHFLWIINPANIFRKP